MFLLNRAVLNAARDGDAGALGRRVRACARWLGAGAELGCASSYPPGIKAFVSQGL